MALTPEQKEALKQRAQQIVGGGGMQATSPASEPQADVYKQASEMLRQKTAQRQAEKPKEAGLLKRGFDAITSNVQNFGRTLGASVVAPDISKDIAAGEQNQAELSQQLRDKLRTKSPEEQRSGLQRLQTIEQGAGGATDIAQIIPETQKSAKQIFGEGLGVAADIASAGTYGSAAKAAQTGRLLTGSERIAGLASKAGMPFVGQTANAVKTPTIQTIKNLATEGTTLGGTYGASQALQQNKSAVDVFKDTGKGLATGGLLGATLGGITGGIQNLKGKKIAPFAQDTELVNVANRLGVEPTAGVTSKSNVPALAEAWASKGLGGKGIVEKSKMLVDDVNRIADDLVNEAGRTSNAVDVGLGITQARDNYIKNFRKIKDQLYKKVSPMQMAMVQVEPVQTKEVLSSIVKGKSGAGAFAENAAFFKSLAKDIENVRYGESTRVTAANLRSKIQGLAKRIKNWNDPVATGSQGELKRVLAAMESDLDNALSAQNSTLKESLDKANAAYAEGINTIKNRYNKTIERLKDRPDELAKAFITNKTSAEEIPEMLAFIGEENADNLRAYLLEQIIKKGRGTNDFFTPAGLQKQLNSYGDKLDIIFTPEQTQTLRDLSKMTAAMKKVNKIVEGSQTSYLLRLAAQFGGFFANPILAIKAIVGDAIFNKFIASEVGQKLLSGELVLDGKTIGKIDNVISPVARRASYQFAQ